MPNRGLTFLQEIRDAILERERLILVVGPSAVTSDYVQAEWQCALQACRVVTPVLRLGEYDLLPEGLKQTHCVDLRPTRPYAEALAELLRILDEPVAELCQLFNVPSLPASFLPRPADLTALNELVLADINQPTVITSARQTTLLQGMGGVGKSVLAAAFARSCEARRAFRDGIAWLKIGQEPDLLGLVQTLAGALGADRREYYDLESAWGLLGKLLAGKSCLLVLDDVWDVRHAERFASALGPGGRLLITSRDGGLASILRAGLHRLDVLPEEDALELLRRYAQVTHPILPESTRQVAQECGRLPFALALCGAMHADQISWEDILNALREADLSFIECQLPNYPYPDLLKSIKVSLDMLGREDPAYEKHYRELAVFPQGAGIPEAAVIQLWVHTNGLNERSARKLLVILSRKALLRLEGDEPQRQVMVHDLQHDYLLAVLRDLGGLHNELLAAYREKCPQGWQDGPDDGYFFQRLPYHLAQAGRTDELKSTLFDYRWLRRKLQALESNAWALVADFDLLQHETGFKLQRALRQAAHVLTQDYEQLPSQLWGRLCDREEPELQALLQQAIREHPESWLRPITPSLAEEQALVGTFTGHTEWVTACILTPDGRQVISISKDKTFRLWDLASGACLHTFKGHRDSVMACALTPDGRQVVSASWDKTLKLWDLTNGTCLRTFEGHRDAVTACVLTPDGRQIVSASGDQTLKLWNLTSGVCLQTFEGHTDWVTACMLTPDGRQVVSTSWDKTIKLWDISPSLDTGISTTIDTDFSSAPFTDPSLMLESGNTSPIRLPSTDFQSRYEGHTGWVTACALTPDGHQVISTSYDHTLKLWNISNNVRPSVTACLRTFIGHTDWVTACAVTPDGSQIVSASADQTLKLWDLPAFEVGDASHAPLLVADCLRTFEGHTDRVTACLLTPDGRLIVSASYDKTLKLWDLASGDCLCTFNGHTHRVTASKLTPDGYNVISASADHTLKLWGLPAFSASDACSSGIACLRTFEGHTDWVTACALSPDGRQVLSASRDKTLKLWDVASGVCLCTFAGHTDKVTACKLALEMNLAISASYDMTIKLWNLTNGACLRTFEGHTGEVNACVLTPDGSRVISASWDKTLKLWNLQTGMIQASFVSDGPLNTCAVTPDGRTLVCGGNSGRLLEDYG
jgi:WD40 repeat protein